VDFEMLASWVHCFEGDGGERLYVVRGGEAIEAPFVEVGAERAMRLLRGWLADPVQRRRLLTLHEGLFGRLATAGWESGEARDRVEEDLRGAFEQRALSVLGLPELSAPMLGDQPSPASRPRPSTTTRSWIEIELLDDGGRRVATELVVTLPDGSKMRPSFSGFLRIEDIDPGLCDIEFPNIDGREWGS
jgi:hypothetical protein